MTADTDALVEVVARAIYETGSGTRPHFTNGPRAPTASQLRQHGVEARAAILATLRGIMDCSNKMVAQAQDRYSADLNGLGRTIIGCLWQEMVAAKIREVEGG